MPFNICILTYNEELTILDCLRSLPQEADVYIIDSYSTDSTLDLVEENFPSVHIFKHNWLGFGEQRNLVRNFELRYEYTLHLDADERLNDEIIQEMEEIIKSGAECVYKIFHKNYFFGGYLKHQRENKAGQIRFGKNDQMKFINSGHGQTVLDKPIRKINNRLEHYPMVRGLSHWLEKHIGYAQKEATFGNKKIYKIYFWPELVFFYDFLFGLGFLDGMRGFYYLRLKYLYYSFVRSFRSIENKI